MSLIKKFIIGEWNLGICNIDFIKEFAKVKRGGELRLPVKWMRHRRYCSFFADPFIYSADKQSAKILSEEYIFPRKKGVISLCTIDRFTGKLLRRKEVLEETCHLSYPFFDGKTCRIYPESFRNGNWTSFYFDGEKVSDKRIITDFPIIDATPVEWNGKWYVMATTQPNALSQLLIFVGDTPEGPFIQHPLNPVKDDISTSRPGGECFVQDNQLFRIVQDSTTRYGESLHIMRVTVLTPNDFKEEFYCDVVPENPSPYNLGFHTLNFKDDIVVVDGYRERFRPFLAIYIYKLIPFFKKLGLLK